MILENRLEVGKQIIIGMIYILSCSPSVCLRSITPPGVNHNLKSYKGQYNTF